MSFWRGKLSRFSANFFPQNKAKNVGHLNSKSAGKMSKCVIFHKLRDGSALEICTGPLYFSDRRTSSGHNIVYFTGPVGPPTFMSGQQCFMQDENVACHDLGKLSFERAVGCFGKPQLERATRFPMSQLERATRFPMPQLERATRFPMSQLERATCFPNVPSRACNSPLNCQFEVCVFDCFCHSMPFICLNISSIN